MASALKKAGYDENKDLFIFNYPNIDFVEKNAELIKIYIESLNKKYGYQQFDLVGYSMGGLVSRFYIENLDGSKYIRKLITIDTPHWGSNLAWNANIKELNYFPCDYFDLNPELSGLFNKSRSDEYDKNKKGEKNKLSHPYDQSHTLKLNHRNVKYYAIAGINSWIGTNDTGSIDNIIDKFIDWEGGQSDVLRHDYLKTVLPTLGDNVVNLYSPIGWGDVGLLDGKPGKQIDMYKMCINIYGKFGNNLVNNLHSDNQHRKVVIDKTIEYLQDGDNIKDSNMQVTIGDWKCDSIGWWYKEANSWVTGWRLIDGNWYYFYY